MREGVIVRVGAKILAPFIIVFALYVHFHGDYSPGGGFQAGVILAAAFALLTLVYGVREAKRVLPPAFVQACAALGVLIFAGTGVATMALGHNYLGYNALAHDPRARPALRHPRGRARGAGDGLRGDGHHLLLLRGARRRHGGRRRSPGARRSGDLGRRDGSGARRRRGVMNWNFFVSHYNYWVVIFLMMVGFYILISRGNLIKKIVGLNIFQTSVFMLYISLGKITEGTPPILIDGGYGAEGAEGAYGEAARVVYSNPLPHVLILTAIVVGIATTSVALALAVRIREAYGTVEEDEINAIETGMEADEIAEEIAAHAVGAEANGGASPAAAPGGAA